MSRPGHSGDLILDALADEVRFIKKMAFDSFDSFDLRTALAILVRMETDSFFCQLLKQLPQTLFELLGLPAKQARGYRFDSVEPRC